MSAFPGDGRVFLDQFDQSRLKAVTRLDVDCIRNRATVFDDFVDDFVGDFLADHNPVDATAFRILAIGEA